MVSEARALIQAGHRAVLIQAPTGSGKTALAVKILGNARKLGKSAWFNVHRRELLTQSAEAFERDGIPYHVLSAAWEKRPLETRGVQINAIATLAKRFYAQAPPDMIVWDETHHLAAGTWNRIFTAFPHAIHIGLTATPERLDGQGLDKHYTAMVEGPTTAWLIAQGFLSPYRLFAPPGISTAGIKTAMGDYARGALNAAADTPTITGDAVAHYKRHADGKRAVVFCVSREHSRHVVGQFISQGIPAAHCDGETDPAVRDGMLKDFRTGKLLVLSNVDLFGEGFDLPAIECCIMLRPTQSLALYLQQVGRVLRVSDGKAEAIILDHAGNAALHGLPDDVRLWCLEGRETRKRREIELGVKPPRVCPKCFAAQPRLGDRCVYCQTPFDLSPRTVEEKEGDLVEVKVVQRPQRELTLADLTRMFARKGVNRPELLAEKVLRQREAKREKSVV